MMNVLVRGILTIEAKLIRLGLAFPVGGIQIIIVKKTLTRFFIIINF